MFFKFEMKKKFLLWTVANVDDVFQLFFFCVLEEF